MVTARRHASFLKLFATYSLGIVRLAVRSRASARPFNLEVNSQPTAGKTHAVAGALALESLNGYYEVRAASEKALIYPEEALEHRTIYFQEPEGLSGGVGAAVIKSLAG